MQGPLCSTHTDMPMRLSVSDQYRYVDMPFSQKENSICGISFSFFFKYKLWDTVKFNSKSKHIHNSILQFSNYLQKPNKNVYILYIIQDTKLQVICILTWGEVVHRCGSDVIHWSSSLHDTPSVLNYCSFWLCPKY